MSTLRGHWLITAEAVRELSREWRVHPLIKALGAADLSVDVVERDIIDLFEVGHWADFGQKHHFMRKFDGQSPYQAYVEAVEWILSNSLETVQTLASRISRYFPEGVGRPGASNQAGNQVFGGQVIMTARGPVVADPPSWHALGNAVHALQDSFSRGHVERDDNPTSPLWPGPITRVKLYGGSEKDGHEAADEAWRGSGPGGLSPEGKFAKDATKELLITVITTAMSARGGACASLVGWYQFQDRWLKASTKLSHSRDDDFDLIDRFYHGVRVGAWNLKTVSMDEEGLAKAIFDEIGTDAELVRKVFVRLDQHYNSDADDVAEIYVNLLMQRGGPPLEAVRGSSDLKQILIKVLKKGWTSAGEQKCIDFLKQLT